VRSNKVPPDLERIGPNVMAYVLYARYRLRLPFNKIQQSLADLHNFKISEGEIANQLEKAQELFKNDYANICELIKISDKVYCDETGWRIRGKNFWIWVFVTEREIRYVIEDTRGGGVPRTALGDNPDRVLISDFYAAYKKIPGRNQYCWVHLLRDGEHTESKLYDDLANIYQQIKDELKKEIKDRDKKRLDKLLHEIAAKNYEAKSEALDKKIKTLQKRIAKTAPNLLTCLDFENVLPENNTAERALRNNVVMRKIFGCSRSVASAKVMEVNTSVIDTLLRQNPDNSFFDLVLPKLKKV
jgi:molybdopterin-biosynthesis enzyme MoeA-like protein